jgi:tetratricopeptide (TPR) repeat protein
MEITMKNRDLKHSYNSKLKSSATLGFRLCFWIFCFMFLPLVLLGSLGEISSANSAAEVSQNLLQGTITPKGLNSQYGQQLWLTGISVAKDQEGTEGKNKLKGLIKQIRSVTFEPQKQTPEPIIIPEEPPVTEPNETLSDTAVPKEEEKRQIETKPPYEPITNQTLQMLKKLSQHPEKMDNPFELGEVLFLSTNLKEAAIFYQEALKRTDANDINSAQDRAWILFQIGNCLRNDDLPVAAKMYGQLITEYPDSPWTELAKAQVKLIDWYQKDEPRKLIAELEYAPSEQNQNR